MSTGPPVVLLYGIWATLLVPTGLYREDSCDRRRPIKKTSRVIILIALGFWPWRSTIRVLDWEITSGDRCEGWDLLLGHLDARRLWWRRRLWMRRLLIRQAAALFREAGFHHSLAGLEAGGLRVIAPLVIV